MPCGWNLSQGCSPSGPPRLGSQGPRTWHHCCLVPSPRPSLYPYRVSGSMVPPESRILRSLCNLAKSAKALLFRQPACPVLFLNVLEVPGTPAFPRISWRARLGLRLPLPGLLFLSSVSDIPSVVSGSHKGLLQLLLLQLLSPLIPNCKVDVSKINKVRLRGQLTGRFLRRHLGSAVG